jgi:two-component sensor histidine kinase
MTILLIEDNPADVEMIREMLSDLKGSSFDIVCADRLSAAKPYFADSRIDIILLDLGLPDSQGLDTLRRVKEHAGEVPIVVLTMLDNEKTGLDALKEGAQDYLVKGQMNGPLITRSLHYAIERGRIEKERKKMTDLVEASLAEKETMLREIHHRVKNNLQIISSLLSLQINKISDPRTIEALRDSQSRVQSMALVHEHLYRGEDFSRIDFSDYIHALATNLFQSYKAADENIQFEQEIAEISVDISTAIPLGLIINELITNSLKYGFKEKKDGLLSITATEDAQSLNIIVGDNGSGIPEGITLENQTSLGLRLVKTLTGQLHGTVAIDRTGGTKFVFTFPKPAEIPGKAGT